jgi:hypothetical protein
LLTESMLLGLLGGAAGLMLSVWASKVLWAGMARTIQGFFWSNVTFVVPMTPDIRVFGYTLLLALLTGVILGLASFLAATQVAVSMVLLIGAGLLVRGLLKSRAVARLAELTELRGVALVERFPMTGTWTSPIVAETGTGAPRGLPGRTVGKSRFPRSETLGVPIVAGRNFTQQESDRSAPLAIISESGARRFFPGRESAGEALQVGHELPGGSSPSFK